MNAERADQVTTTQNAPQLDAFQLLMKHAASRKRKRMTKAELLADAEAGDNAYLDMATERDMADAYWRDLDAHLKAVHGCDHDIYAEPQP